MRYPPAPVHKGWCGLSYIDEKALADRLAVSVRTVQRWRVTGEGPPFTRMGAWRIVYRLDVADAWASDRAFPHRTAESAAKRTAA